MEHRPSPYFLKAQAKMRAQWEANLHKRERRARIGMTILWGVYGGIVSLWIGLLLSH